MISFRLTCKNEHGFDGWFSSSADYEEQLQRGFLTCPVCGSGKVQKSLMAPAVSSARSKEMMKVASTDQTRAQVLQELKRLRDAITQNSENVGGRFPEEARKIHYGETEARAIVGEASQDQVRDLLDEGIEVAPLPRLPDDAN